MLSFKLTQDKLEVYSNFIVNCDKYALKTQPYTTQPVCYNMLISSIPLGIYQLASQGYPLSIVIKVKEIRNTKNYEIGKIIIPLVKNKSLWKKTLSRVFGDVRITNKAKFKVDVKYKSLDEFSLVSYINASNLEFDVYYRPYKKHMLFLKTITSNLYGVFKNPSVLFKAKKGICWANVSILNDDVNKGLKCN